VGGGGGRDGGSDPTNVQCKAIWNCHNESPLYNEYILIKMGKKRTVKRGNKQMIENK
jgi:hypothetical protein